MKLSIHLHSVFINMFKTLFRSIVFNSVCIVFFGLIYFLVSTQPLQFDQYFILSTKAQFFFPIPTDKLNIIERDVILFQKAFGLIGFILISIKFLKHFF